MDWQEIEAFLAVADLLHFGRAAERLRLSQARVSQLVKRLERRIGAPLFERTTRRVELTPIGRGLLEDLRPAHRSILDGLARARAAGRGVDGDLRVGFLGPLAGRVLLDVADALAASRPGLEVHLVAAEVADPCRPLRDGAIDLLLTQLPVAEPGIVTGPVVIVEPRLLAVAAGHPLAGEASVSLEVLAEERVLLPAGAPPQWTDNAQPWTTPGGRPIGRGPAVGSFQELLTSVAAGQGVCTVAAHNVRYHPRPDVAFVPFSDAAPFEFGLVWRASAETARVRAFAEATERLVGEWGGPTAAAERLPAAGHGEGVIAGGAGCRARWSVALGAFRNRRSGAVMAPGRGADAGPVVRTGQRPACESWRAVTASGSPASSTWAAPRRPLR